MNSDFMKKLCKMANSTNVTKYILFFEQVFKAESESEIFDFFRRSQITKKQYENYLEKFKIKFPNNEEELSYLKEIYDKFEQKYVKKKIVAKTVNKSELITNEILESGYTVEEYCANLGISISDTYLSICKSKIYQEHIDEFNNRSKESFNALLKNLIYGVLYENMDILDYYMQTNLDLNDFVRLSRKILTSTSDKVAISKFGQKAQNLMSFSTTIKEQEFKKVTSINGCEVTTEEKEKIFTFLEQNNIPIKLYPIALNRYIMGTLDITQKTKKK